MGSYEEIEKFIEKLIADKFCEKSKIVIVNYHRTVYLSVKKECFENLSNLVWYVKGIIHTLSGLDKFPHYFQVSAELESLHIEGETFKVE